MKITINIDENVEMTEIAISCRELTTEIEKVISTLRMMNQQLTVQKGDTTYILDVSKVIYIEAVDRKTFVYTKEEVYESSFRLYELELQLETSGFFRISKNCIIQLKLIRSLRADIQRKLKLTMENGEEIMVSRQYSDAIKKRLGVK